MSFTANRVSCGAYLESVSRTGAAGRSVLAGLMGLLFLALTVANGRAQEVSPEHLSKAREAVVLSNAAQGFDKMLGVLAEQSRATLTRTNPHLANEISEAAKAASLSLTGRINLFVDKVARIYAAHFTIAELDNIIAFYKTDTGRKMAERSGQIIIETLEANRVWSGELSTEMMERVREELAKAGHRL